MKQIKTLTCLFLLTIFSNNCLAKQGYIIELINGEEIKAQSVTTTSTSVDYTTLEGYPGLLSHDDVLKIKEVTDIEKYEIQTVPVKQKELNDHQICIAGIAKIMGRSPSIIKVYHEEKNVIFLSYMHEQKKWKYKCKIQDNRIIWGADDGRWRTHPMDSQVTFKITGDLITVTDSFSDGSSSNKTFTFEELIIESYLASNYLSNTEKTTTNYELESDACIPTFVNGKLVADNCSGNIVPDSKSETFTKRISSDSYFGCTSKEYHGKLVGYAVAKDMEAFKKGLMAGVLAGHCTMFKAGEEVYLVDTAFFSGMVKVRKRSGVGEYWTNIEAVK